MVNVLGVAIAISYKTLSYKISRRRTVMPIVNGGGMALEAGGQEARNTALGSSRPYRKNSDQQRTCPKPRGPRCRQRCPIHDGYCPNARSGYEGNRHRRSQVRARPVVRRVISSPGSSQTLYLMTCTNASGSTSAVAVRSGGGTTPKPFARRVPAGIRASSPKPLKRFSGESTWPQISGDRTDWIGEGCERLSRWPWRCVLWRPLPV